MSLCLPSMVFADARRSLELQPGSPPSVFVDLLDNQDLWEVLSDIEASDEIEQVRLACKSMGW